jgi:hypothetical protein
MLLLIFSTADHGMILRIPLSHRRSQPSCKVHVNISQLAREKSLVPKCSAISRNSRDISKRVFQNDAFGFESYMPSQINC